MTDSEDENDFQDASPSLLRETASDIVNEAVYRSTVFNPDAEARLPRFNSLEIVCGRILGQGGFCTVCEIKSFKIPNQEQKRTFRRKISRTETGVKEGSDESTTNSGALSREHVAASCIHKGKPRYCIKRLSENGRNLRKMAYVKGVVDLALEAKYLAILNHANIINLIGLSRVGPFQEGYFLVLERLMETLTKRMKTWIVIDRQCRGVTGALTGGRKKKSSFIVERLQVAHDVASAVGYMHEMNIIYRDLKPCNVGFDSRGVVKLFDMGLTKELREEDKDANGNFRLTGFTGSIRYMAPEVGRREPYNLSADVYSFGLFLWYIMALEPPFGLFTPEMVIEKVFEHGCRPVTLIKWSDELSSLIQMCWDHKADRRPDFEVVKSMLWCQIRAFRPDRAALLDQSSTTSSSR